MREPDIVLSETSPNRNIEAIVEQDDRVAYFYLWSQEAVDFGLRGCWVRNLAPWGSAAVETPEGGPPMLPREHCAHPDGALALKPEDLSVVWFEEGDAAALLEAGSILAVVPGWSGKEGFHGYARDHIGQSNLAWELGTRETNLLFDRIDRAAEFWEKWQSDDAWDGIQERFLAVYRDKIGSHSNYYAIDGGEWPPKALVKIPNEQSIVLATLGVSIRPQPVIEQYSDSPELHRRIELGAAFDRSVKGSLVDDFAAYISGLTRTPWDQITFYGHGHTVPCGVFRKHDGSSPFEAVMLMSDPPGAPQLALPKYRGDRVNMFWTIPIMAAERDLAMRQGCAKLAERLAKSGNYWVHRNRPSAV